MTNKLKQMTLPGLVAVLAAGLLLAGCSDRTLDCDPDGEFNLSVAFKLDSPLAADVLQQAVMIVTGENIETPIEVPLAIDDNLLTGQADVPAGPGRLFVINAYDGLGNLFYRGETTTDILADQINEINMNLYPQVPYMNITPRRVDILQRDTFQVRIKAYNLDDLHEVTIKLTYGDNCVPDSVFIPFLGPNVGYEAWRGQSNNEYFINIFGADPTDVIVDDSGYAYLARVYFRTFSSDFPVDTAEVVAIPQEMISKTGDTLSTTVFNDGGTVAMTKLSVYQVAHWTFNDPSGDIVLDRSDNNLHGTAYGPTIVQGYARNFDGLNDYIEVPHNDAFNITDRITIVMETYIGFANRPMVLLSKRVPDSDINYSITYEIGTTDRLTLEFGSESTAYSVPAPLRDEAMHQVAFSVDFDNPEASIVCMIDGVQAYGDWNLSAGLIEAPETNDHNLQIGRQLGSQGYYFDGLIDDIDIYNVSLTFDQMRNNFFAL